MAPFRRLLTGAFLSSGGLIGLAAAESTVFFWFPFGVDVAVILLVARHQERAWLYPVLATVGSIAGTAVTYWMGRKIGEKGLDRYVPERRLKSLTARINEKGAVALAVLGIIPPPFPFTALALVSGALQMNFVQFIAMLAAVRLMRFGAEAFLATRFGTLVIRWLNSDAVEYVVFGLALLALAGTAVSIYALWRRTRGAMAATRRVAAT